jgi:ABC-type phosphate transport system substrate-binding protein
LLAGIVVVCASLDQPATATAGEVHVIVNPDQSQVALDSDLLRGIFTMRVREWPDGTPVHVFILPDESKVSDRFYRKELGTYSYVLRAAWDRLVYTGTGLAPVVVQSEAEMRARVQRTPGGIGFVADGGKSSLWPLIQIARGSAGLRRE